MDILFGLFLIVSGWFLFVMASYIRTEEMLTTLKISRELDEQYYEVVCRVVSASKSEAKAVKTLQEEVHNTILDMDGHNYELDVRSEWRGK